MTRLLVAAAMTCIALAASDVRIAPGQWERRIEPRPCSVYDAATWNALLGNIPAGTAVLMSVRDPNGQAVRLTP